jgi:hypothetical protein
LTVLNTLSPDIDDIIPCTWVNDKRVEYGSRGRRNFQKITNFPIKSFRVVVKKIGLVG